MAKPWSRRFVWGWFLLGCVVPDIIDKTLYYSLAWSTGLRGQDLGLISGTRTFGHSGIFYLALLAVAGFTRSRAIFSVLAGMATHLVLDTLVDSLDGGDGTIQAFFFPLRGWFFSAAPFSGLQDHLTTILKKTPIVVGEIAGCILFWRAWNAHGRPGLGQKKSPPVARRGSKSATH